MDPVTRNIISLTIGILVTSHGFIQLISRPEKRRLAVGTITSGIGVLLLALGGAPGALGVPEPALLTLAGMVVLPSGLVFSVREAYRLKREGRDRGAVDGGGGGSLPPGL